MGRRMTTAKTAAQRQAERKARKLAAGQVQWKRWVHRDDVPALARYADRLAKRRAAGPIMQKPHRCGFRVSSLPVTVPASSPG